MTEPTSAIDTPHTCGAERLRIAFFSDSLAERNGTGAYYHDLAAHLGPRVEAVEVLQPDPRKGLTRLAVPLPGDTTQTLALPSVFRIRRLMAELRPHVVVTVTPGPFGLLGMWLARRYGCAFLSAYHTNFDALAELYWGPLRRRLANATLGAVNRFICARSATVLVNNSALVDTVRALEAPHVDVVGTPIEQAFLTSTPPRPPATLGQVCYAGRLAAEKNIESVIDAAGQWPDLRFVIAGDGPMRATVEAAAAHHANLDYRGWLDRAALCELIDESGLVVLPSHFETFGSIALEAMVRGRPVLISANAGIHDWPQVASSLYTLDPGESLAAAIGRLRDLPGESLARTGEHAREGALRLHRETLDQWLSVLSANARGHR